MEAIVQVKLRELLRVSTLDHENDLRTDPDARREKIEAGGASVMAHGLVTVIYLFSTALKGQKSECSCSEWERS